MANILRRFFQNSSFHNKLTLTYLLIILVPLMVFTAMFAHTYADLNLHNIQKVAEMVNFQGTQYLNTLAGNMRFSASILLYDESLLSFFMDDQTRAEQTALYNRLSSQLYNNARNNRVLNIRLFVHPNYFFASEKKNFFSYQDAFDRGWLTETLLRPESHWTMDEYVYVMTTTTTPVKTLSYVTSTANLKRYDICTALVVVDVLEEEVLRMLEYFIGSLDGCEMYIVNEADEVILSTRKEAAPTVPSGEVSRWRGWDHAGEKYRLYANALKMDGLRLVTVLSEKAVAAAQMQGIWQLLWLVLLISGIVFVFVLLMSKFNAQRIYRLNRYAARVQRGDLTPTTEEFGTDEIGQLSDAFTYTITILAQVMEEQKESLKRVKDSEIQSIRSNLEVLQTQINPHFLYNTLSMISWTAAKYGCAEAEAQILMLSRYYKGCLSGGETLVTIQSEIENVALYVKLHSMRTGVDITLCCHVDEIASCLIPKLTIQPIVENAILHGIYPKESKRGQIAIVGFEKDAYYYLRVDDDGVGFSPVEPHPATIQSGYGIENVRRRLRLSFGETCDISFSPIESGGTSVLIRIARKN